MNLLFPKDVFCRPAGAVTAATVLLRSDSFPAVSMDRHSDLVFCAAAIGSHVLSLVGRLVATLAILRSRQPVWAATRP